MDTFYMVKDGSQLNSVDGKNYYDNSHGIHLIRHEDIFTDKNNMEKKYKLVNDCIYPMKNGDIVPCATAYIWYK